MVVTNSVAVIVRQGVPSISHIEAIPTEDGDVLKAALESELLERRGYIIASQGMNDGVVLQGFQPAPTNPEPTAATSLPAPDQFQTPQSFQQATLTTTPTHHQEMLLNGPPKTLKQSAKDTSSLALSHHEVSGNPNRASNTDGGLNEKKFQHKSRAGKKHREAVENGTSHKQAMYYIEQLAKKKGLPEDIAKEVANLVHRGIIPGKGAVDLAVKEYRRSGSIHALNPFRSSVATINQAAVEPQITDRASQTRSARQVASNLHQSTSTTSNQMNRDQLDNGGQVNSPNQINHHQPSSSVHPNSCGQSHHRSQKFDKDHR